MDENPRIHVVRRSPQPNERPLRHDPQLIRKRGGKFRGGGLSLPLFLFDCLGLDSLDFVESLLEFGRFVPQLRPIPITNPGSKSGTDRVEHIFRWVHVVRTHRIVTSEVLADNR